MTELHLHLDGSLRPETVYELAVKQGIDIGIPGLKALSRDKGIDAVKSKLQAPVSCRDLNDYLECFRPQLAVLQEEDAIERCVAELGEDLVKDGVTKAEIRFSPHYCCTHDLTPKDAVRAAERGARTAMRRCPDLTLSLILCCMRGQEDKPFLENPRPELRGERVNYDLVDLTKELMNDVVKAVDLAGAEALFPTSRYIPLFRYAAKEGVPFTIHAGEADGRMSIRAAIEAGAVRIGHGVRAIEDRVLMEQLVKKKITLECCVISNFQTRVFPQKEDHPIRKLFDAGVRVTLNTDNRTVSNTTMRKEIETVQRMFGFTGEEIRTMQRYAEEALF
ncbi:MAG: adenosine deaminase [Lachnospiraceae bacterium]|nr:adenosine deaminase [Lachnospiraceae bacterium]